MFANIQEKYGVYHIECQTKNKLIKGQNITSLMLCTTSKRLDFAHTLRYNEVSEDHTKRKICGLGTSQLSIQEHKKYKFDRLPWLPLNSEYLFLI